MKKKQTKKVVASEDKMEKGATDNKSVAPISKKFRVIKEYCGIEVGTILEGEYQHESHMIENGYWERI